ncbi:MAG TPA: hypothetical protein VIK37_01235 [Candidatus Saccharimonadales bacterium]
MENAQRPLKEDLEDVIDEQPPLKPEEFVRSVRDYVEHGIERMESKTSSTHEVAVQIGEAVVPASELKVILKKTGETILKHKGVIVFATGLTVAGLLTVRHTMHARKKRI